MEPLWKLYSGEYAGRRSPDGQLFDALGHHVGYFKGDIAYSTRGRYIGEIYRDGWIGYRKGVSHPIIGSTSRLAAVVSSRLPNRVGLSLSGWKDPDF